MTTKQIPLGRAKVTLIDKRNPLSHIVCLLWQDKTHHIDDFDLSPLGNVVAVQDDLLAFPPRGWVTLDGNCRRRTSSYVKLLPARQRRKRALPTK